MANLDLTKLDRLTKPRTKLGHNTYAFKYDDLISVEYHGNIIANITPTEITLTLAGWGTPTTRTRLNQIAHHFGLNASYSQRNHEQHLNGEPISSYEEHTWSR